MRTVWQVFLRDCKRILRNPVAAVVTLGVAVLPSCMHGSTSLPTGILIPPPATCKSPSPMRTAAPPMIWLAISMPASRWSQSSNITTNSAGGL